MIDITIAVAERLRTHAGESFANVGLVANFAALSGLPAVMPAAYVLPLQIDAQANQELDGVTQITTLTFGVLLLARHAGDASGAKGTALIESLRCEVSAALTAWAPPDCIDTIKYTGGALVETDAGTVVWRDDFEVSRLMSSAVQTT